MTRTLLVLGATGFLGVEVVRAAIEADLDVVAVARRRSKLIDDALAMGRGRRIDLDATDLAALARLLDELEPVAIVNAVAIARVADCAADPGLARRVNGELPGELAQLARERNVRFVHVSTDLVFGARPAPASGFAEHDEPGPTSVYGATKLAGERAVLAADPSALVVRLPLLCGDSHGRGLGASDAVLAAVARGERPRLFVDEVRTPLDVEVAARALVELARRDLAGILHVAGPERMTRLELGLRALRAAGRADPELSVEAASRDGLHADRPADVALDATRARAMLATELRAPFDRA